jgi:membrane dipeptidase
LVRDRRATLADVTKQILYVSHRVGVEHVAIGSDFEGGIRPPRGLANLGEVQHLVPALRAAGLDDASVRAILGENAMRVLAP